MTCYNMVDEVVACYTMQGVVHNHSYSTLAVKKVTPELLLTGKHFFTYVFLQPTEGTPIALQAVATLPPGVLAQPGGFELNLEVEDVDAAWQAWKAKGVEVLTEVTDMGAGRFFRAKDPEGHVLSVFQLYPQVKAMRP